MGFSFLFFIRDFVDFSTSSPTYRNLRFLTLISASVDFQPLRSKDMSNSQNSEWIQWINVSFCSKIKTKDLNSGRTEGNLLSALALHSSNF